MSIEISHVRPSLLKAYEGNARTHSETQVDQLCASIREFGFVNPVLADENNVVIAGHGRLMAAVRLKLKTVPVIYVPGMTEAKKRALRIADNKIALNSGWDFDKLNEELEALASSDYDLGITGFNDAELDAILKTDIILPDESSPAQAETGQEERPAAPVGFEQSSRVEDPEPSNDMIPLGPSVSTPSTLIKKVKFDSYTIPLTDEEHEKLTDLVRICLDDHGTLAGFFQRYWFQNGGGE